MNKTKESMKEYLDDVLSPVSVSNDLKNKIFNLWNEKQRSGITRPGRYIPRGIALAAGCIMLMTTMTVFAAVIPGVNDLVYSFYPALAEKLYPVDKSNLDQGIEVSVLYAANDNHYAAVYFSIQDTEMLGRVDERLDLMDSYGIGGPFSSTVNKVAFNKDTQTAYFLMQGSGAESLSGKMNTFRLSDIMSRKSKYELYDTKVDLSQNVDLEAKSVNIEDYSYTGGGSADFVTGRQDILEPDVMNISLGENIDFVTITNMGFVDGYFHIQTKWPPSFDNHGQLLLIKPEHAMGLGQEADTGELQSVDCFGQSFRTTEDEALCGKDVFTKHIEYIYNISSPEELKDYSLWASLTEDGIQTKGNWKVAFRLEDSERLIIQNGLEQAEELEVTELGMYVTGYQGDYKNYTCEITLKNGQVLNQITMTAMNDNREKPACNLGAVFDTPIQIDNIDTISLDGKIIYDVN